MSSSEDDYMSDAFLQKLDDSRPGLIRGKKAEFEKTIVFHSCFLENTEDFLNFGKIFGKFFNFLEFSKIIENSLVFPYALLNFLDFS